MNIFQVLLPSLTCAVVSLGDRNRLEALQGYQADLSAGEQSFGVLRQKSFDL